MSVPPLDDLDEPRLRELGAKVDAIVDPNGHKHWRALNDASPTRQVGEVVWYLVRHGLTARSPQSSGLLRTLSENVRHAATAAEIVDALRGWPDDMTTLDRGHARDYSQLTPKVLLDIDELLVELYLRDRDALMAAREGWGEHLRLAADFVRRRAGEAIDAAAAEAIFDHLVVAHGTGYGIASNHDVPRIVDGARVEARLADTDAVRELALLFGSEEAWAEGLEAVVRPRVKAFRESADSLAPRILDGLRRAELGDVVYLFGDGWWGPGTVLKVLDVRDDAPEDLLAAAATLRSEGTAPFRVDIDLIDDEKGKPKLPDLDAVDAGGGDDDEYGDDDEGYSDDDYDDYDDYDDDGGDEDEEDEEECFDAEPTSDRVRCLAEALTIVAVERSVSAGRSIPDEADAAFDLERVVDSDPSYIARIRGAIASLGRDRARAIVRRILAKPYYFGKAVILCDVCGDAAVTGEILDRVDAGDYPIEAGLLGACGLAVVEEAAARAAAQQEPKRAHAYREGILYVLARASAEGVAWGDALDRHIDLTAVYFAYGGAKVEGVLAMLDRLPLARYAAVLETNLPRCAEEPWRLARCLRADTPAPLIAAVFRAVVARPEAIESGSLGDRLRALGEGIVAPLAAAIGDQQLPGTFMRELERALDSDVYAALSAALSRPVETKLEELRRLAASLEGPKARIYLLSRSASGDAGGIARAGGAPIGVPADALPRFREEPMKHVLTLDLRQLPELRAQRPDAAALALFLPDPDEGRHHRRGALVWIEEGALADAPEGGAAIEVEPVDVPLAIFAGRCEGDLARVRSLVYGWSGYVGGEPLWLQEPEDEPDFLLQFDESLVDINLGDCGVMYVFDGAITWQCH